MKELWGYPWPCFCSLFLGHTERTDYLLMCLFFYKTICEYAFWVFLNSFSFKFFFWKRDKQVMIEFKAIPIPPTSSPSDIITVSLACAYLNIFWFWLSSNQIAFLTPTQTHNLEASLKWLLLQFNYNALQSRKLFKEQWKLCLCSPFFWKKRRNTYV